jgi:hypothetical protein
MKMKFQDPGFSFQLLRVLGNASSRQADVGEALATGGRARGRNLNADRKKEIARAGAAARWRERRQDSTPSGSQ